MANKRFHTPDPMRYQTTDPSTVSSQDLYRLMIGAIVPRPIAFVSTISAAGSGNLAPFSFFNGVSSNPPCLCISITPKNAPPHPSQGSDSGAEPQPGPREKPGPKTDLKPDLRKDTLRNIEETGQFVVNIVTAPLAHAVNQCSADYPYGVDELRKVGLHALASQKVRPVRVAESPIHFECEFHSRLDVGDGSPGSATLIVGKIVLAHVAEELLVPSGRGWSISAEKLNPLSRLGGLSYGLTREIFELPRPSSPPPDEDY